MSYVPVAYTDLASVKRILRSDNKIRIGPNPNNHFTEEEVTEYIKDASMKIDGMLRLFVSVAEIPLSSTAYPEIMYAAPRLTAFLIYRDIYQQKTSEELPIGPRGWLSDAEDSIKTFKKNLDGGIYPTLSPSSSAPSWETAREFFQKKIGVSIVNDQIGNVSDQAPINTGDNIGPYTDS